MKLETQFFLFSQTFCDSLARVVSCAALANTLVGIQGSDIARMTSLIHHVLELYVQPQESRLYCDLVRFYRFVSHV